MKTFNKLALCLGLVAALTGCKEGNGLDYSMGQWDAADGYKNVCFENTSESIELDPADDCVAYVTINRKVTEGACVVPLEIIQNTDDVFEVGECAFADGEDQAQVRLSFPNAEIGKEYMLELAITDKKFVSSYSDNVSYKFTVNRVKWNPAGFMLDEDGTPMLDEAGDTLFGYAMYTEDIIRSYWGIDIHSYPVRLQERDDTPGMYRIVNPYSEYWPYAAYADKSKTYYIYINAVDPDYVFLTGGLTGLGVDINDAGEHEVISYVEYVAQKNGLDTSDPDDIEKIKKNYPEYGGTLANGKITFPKQSLLQAVGGDGYYYANSHGDFCLVIDPTLDPYIASIENDFDWEPYGNGSWTLMSGKLGTSHDVDLYKGVCVTTTDDCDKRFAKEWGDAFMVVSPYAEDYNVVFTVKDGSIYVPEGYEYQALGIKALGEDIYAHINIAHSTFAEKSIVLNITFTNKEGTMEYGSADETLSNVQWNSLGVGTMTDDMIIPLFEMDPVTYRVEIQEREDAPGLLRIVDPFGPDVYPYYDALAEDFMMPEPGSYLVIDATDPEGVYVPYQELGMDLGDGPIGFLTEAASYLGEGYGLDLLKEYGITGWIEDGVINFPAFETKQGSGVYYQGYLTENGQLAYYAGMEGAFQITLPQTAATAKALASAKAKKNYVTRLPKKVHGVKTPFKKSFGFNTKKARTFQKVSKKAF